MHESPSDQDPKPGVKEVLWYLLSAIPSGLTILINWSGLSMIFENRADPVRVLALLTLLDGAAYGAIKEMILPLLARRRRK